MISSTEAANIKFVHDTIRQGFLHAGLQNEEVIIAMSIDRRVGIASLDAIFCAIRNADMQLLMRKDDFDRLLNGIQFQNSVQEIILAASVPDAVDLGEIFRSRVLSNVHFVLTFAMSITEFSDLQIPLPGECSIDMWLPYGLEELENIAQEAIIDLGQRIDEHSINVVEIDVRKQVLSDIQDEKNRQSGEELLFENTADGSESWSAEEAEMTVQESIRVQHEVRDSMKQQIRLAMPRQMAATHIEMERLNLEFCALTGHRSYLSAVSFRNFCRSFQALFMTKHTYQYNHRKKLKIAIQIVARCETDLSLAQVSFEGGESKGGVSGGRNFCQSIVTNIKSQTAALEKVKAQLAGLESQLIFAHDKIEDSQDTFNTSHMLRETERANVVAKLQFFSAETAIEIARLTPVPASIGHLLDVVLVLLSRQLNPIQTFETNTRTIIKVSWMHAVSLLKRPIEFIQALQQLDLDTINPEQLEIIQPYISSEELSAENMQQIANGIAAPLVPWIQALVQYYYATKKSRLDIEHFNNLTKHSTNLQIEVDKIRLMVKEGQDQVELLRKQYDEAVSRKQSLAEDRQRQKDAITTAADLIEGLQVQQARWNGEYSEHDSEIGKLAGNCSIAAAFLTYCGLLDSDYRHRVEHDVLMNVCKEARVQLKMPINNLALLSTHKEMAQWRSQGLLSDDTCSENACMVKHSSSWPLIIDPFGDALAWILNHHKENKEDVRVIHANEDTVVSLAQTCASYGIVFFVLGVDSDIAFDFGDLYAENFRGIPAPRTVNIGGECVEFNPSFQMYFATRLKIPQYSDDFVSRISVVNFGSSANVLELQMTAALLALADKESAARRIDVFQKEIDLSVRITYNRDRLVDALCEIEGNVVESVDALNEIKSLRKEIGDIKQTQENQRKDRERLMRDIDAHVQVHLRIATE